MSRWFRSAPTGARRSTDEESLKSQVGSRKSDVRRPTSDVQRSTFDVGGSPAMSSAPKIEVPQTLRGAVIPSHIAIIMDGNGRWAKKKGLAGRIFGHRSG